MSSGDITPTPAPVPTDPDNDNDNDNDENHVCAYCGAIILPGYPRYKINGKHYDSMEHLSIDQHRHKHRKK